MVGHKHRQTCSVEEPGAEEPGVEELGVEEHAAAAVVDYLYVVGVVENNIVDHTETGLEIVPVLNQE